MKSSIRIRYKKYMRDNDYYYRCYNVMVNAIGDNIRLEFDQKILFGQVHRDIILMKEQITDIQITQPIKEIPNMEIRQ